MTRNIFAFICLLLTGLPAQAQQPTKIPRVGFLIVAPLSTFQSRTEAFQQGLRELKYVEGKNIVIEWRSAEGKVDRLLALAAELVSLKVDVIVTGSGTVTRPAKEATSTIPIVMALDNDPVGNGFLSPALRDLAVTLLDCQAFLWTRAENNWSF